MKIRFNSWNFNNNLHHETKKSVITATTRIVKIFPYLASRLRVATVTARFVVVSDAGALVALRIQNQDGLVLKVTNIRNGRSLYSIDQDLGLGTRSTGHSKSRSASSENDRDHKIPSTTSWVLL